MSKYEALGNFLRAQAQNELPLTFERIEGIIGGKLPASANLYRAWWSNNPQNSVMTKAWLDAGFRSERVDMEGRKLVFRRVDRKRPAEGGAPSAPGQPSGRHPLIGWMKGTLTIAPGVDLTQPADPEWGEVAYGEGNWDERK